MVVRSTGGAQAGLSGQLHRGANSSDSVNDCECLNDRPSDLR